VHALLLTQISFNNLVKMFDGDRKGSFMERFFMPIRFKTSLTAVKRQATRDTSKSEYVHRKSKTMESLSSEIEAEHEVIKSLSSEIDAEHEVIQNVVEELSEERRAIDMLTEKMDVLTLRLDELRRKNPQPAGGDVGIAQQDEHNERKNRCACAALG